LRSFPGFRKAGVMCEKDAYEGETETKARIIHLQG
jgi:hypothetical protein